MENEPRAGFNKEEVKLAPLEGICFHAFQTHAGASGTANFRLFAGSVNTPEGYSILSHSQSYYELEEGDAFGAYRPAVEYIGEDDDHSDAVLYPEWKKNLKKWSQKRREPGSIAIPPGGSGFIFYDYLKEAYAHVGSSGSNPEWGW